MNGRINRGDVRLDRQTNKQGVTESPARVGLAQAHPNYIMDSSGIDTDLEEFIISSVNLQCTCGTDNSSHHRSCSLNPRNKGKPAEKSDVEVITSEDAKPLVIGKTPSIGWMNSAALLMQDYTGE